MTKLIHIVLLTCCMLTAGLARADDHAPMTFMPIETYGCSYNEGMGLADLLAVAEEWNAWTEKAIPQAGFAAVLTPYLYDSRDLGSDVYWMNISTTFATSGSGQDDWLAKGSEMNAKFEAVCTTDSHAMFVGQGVRRPESGGPGASGMLLLSFCTAKEGITPAEMLAADEAYRARRAELGMQGGAMRWFPVAGLSRQIDADFMMVIGMDSMESFGSNMDTLIANMATSSNSHDDIQACRDGTMFTYQTVRAPTQE